MFNSAEANNEAARNQKRTGNDFFQSLRNPPPVISVIKLYLNHAGEENVPKELISNGQTAKLRRMTLILSVPTGFTAKSGHDTLQKSN